jgi:GAF domain-containing protein
VLLDTAQVVVGSAGLTGWIAETGGTPAEWAFCSQVVGSGRSYVVEDATVDPIQKDNPLVFADGLECYLGVPVVDTEGRVLGAHCVLDHAPRTFTDQEVATLEAAAREAGALLDAHRRAPAA